jgi:hypothetical protein
MKAAVLTRDGHTCIIPYCGRRTDQVHHIAPYGVVREHRVPNLVSLCWEHHDVFGRRPDLRNVLYDLVRAKESERNRRFERREAGCARSTL